MSGIAIEYLLGLYFFIISLSYANGRISADFVKLCAGILLIALAIFGKGFIQ